MVRVARASRPRYPSCVVRPRPLAWIAALLAACVVSPDGSPGPPAGWELRAPLAPGHVFAPAIRAWQAAQGFEELPPASAPEPDPGLARELAAFERELRSTVVGRVLGWVRAQADVRFVDDGADDHWPTFGELLHRGRDDCDGLELLTFRLLRGAGFGRGEIYRAVLAGSEGEAHHMVTLWFADGPGSDPLVLDPLHQVVYRPTPLGEIAGWTPVVLFDEHDAFGARAR